MVNRFRCVTVSLVALVIVEGCGSIQWVDTDDARLFDGAEPYMPDGLLCGLAYERGYGRHLGASCQGEYDPAFEYQVTATVVVAEGKNEDAPCPDDADSVAFGDHDGPTSEHYGAGRWSTCVMRGNALTSSADPHELPAGAVCGLATPKWLHQDRYVSECETADPSKGKCPDGFELKWISDLYFDGVNDDCLPDGSEVSLVRKMATPYFYCSVKDEVGCHEGDCPDPLPYEGLICGLHMRGRLDYSDEGVYLQDETQLNDPASVPYDPQAYQTLIDEWYAWCPQNDEYDMTEELLGQMRTAIEEEPSCMGRSVADGQCPEGLELVCTPGWNGDSLPGSVSYTSLCWCTTAGSKQEIDEANWTPDTGRLQ